MSNSKEIHIKANPQHLPGLLGEQHLCRGYITNVHSLSGDPSSRKERWKMGPFEAIKNMHEAPASSSAFAVTALRWVVGHSWGILAREHVGCHAGQCLVLEAMGTKTQ